MLKHKSCQIFKTSGHGPVQFVPDAHITAQPRLGLRLAVHPHLICKAAGHAVQAFSSLRKSSSVALPGLGLSGLAVSELSQSVP